MVTKISVLLALLGVAMCSYPGAYGPYRYGLGKPYGRAYVPAPVKVIKVEADETPKPFQFAYDVTDLDGNAQARQESGDENGVVKGTYGYKTNDGIFRQVEYVADENGFRANIKTNEPGTDNQNPADVTIESAPAVVEVAPKEEQVERTIAIKPALGLRYGRYGAPYYGSHGYGPYGYGHGHGYGNGYGYRHNAHSPYLGIHNKHGHYGPAYGRYGKYAY